MKLQLPKGDTSRIIHVFVPDSTSTTGAGNQLLQPADFAAAYLREGDAAVTVLTAESIAALGTYQAPTTATNFRIGELTGSADMPGVYEIHLRNELLATGADNVIIMLTDGATGTAPSNNVPPIPIEIQLTNVNLNATPITKTELREEIVKGSEMVRTTIATYTDDQNFTLSDGPGENDVFNNHWVKIVDQATATQVSYDVCKDYTGSTKSMVLATTPRFTLNTGDTVIVLSHKAGAQAI